MFEKIIKIIFFSSLFIGGFFYIANIYGANTSFCISAMIIGIVGFKEVVDG